jgi:probable HAF family extracellular repeat protein
MAPIRCGLIGWCVLATFATCDVLAAGMYHVTELGLTRVRKLNDAGQVIANDSQPVYGPDGSQTGTWTNIATRYTAYGPEAGKVERIGDDSTQVLGINNAGQTLVTKGLDIALADGTQLKPLGLSRPGTQPIALNDAGQALTTDSVWQNGTVTPLERLPYSQGIWTSAINNAGQAVGVTYLSDRQHATMWGNGRAQDLGTLGGSSLSSYASGLNDAGTVVGWSSISGASPDIHHAFVFKNGTMTDLGTLPGGVSSSASAINAAGDIVGASSVADAAGWHAFLVHDGHMLDLNTLTPKDLGLTLMEAIDINSLGQILAIAQDSRTGTGHTVLLTPEGLPIPADPIPAPEPTTFVVLALGLGGLTLRRRRRGAA